MAVVCGFALVILTFCIKQTEIAGVHENELVAITSGLVSERFEIHTSKVITLMN